MNNSNRKETIAVFGLFGSNNFGNLATLEATVSNLSRVRPQSEFILISPKPKSSQVLKPFKYQINHDSIPVAGYIGLIRPYRLQKYIRPLAMHLTEPLRFYLSKRQARAFDLLIIAGTGIADDFGQTPYDVPIDLLRWCKAAKATGARVWFMSIGAGPAHNELIRKWFKSALQLADFRSYRDEASKQFALEIGVNAKCDAIIPDIVMSKELPKEIFRNSNWPPKNICIGLMNFRGWNQHEDKAELIYQNYIKGMISIADDLLSRNFKLTVITGNESADKLALNDFARRIHKSNPDSHVTICELDSTRAVFEAIAQSDLVIATRFHNVLKAILMLRPVISIGYGTKNHSLMKSFGLAEYSFSADCFCPDTVLSKVSDITSRSENPALTLAPLISECKRKVEHQFNLLCKADSKPRFIPSSHEGKKP